MTGRPNGNIMVKFAFVCVLVILVFAVVNMQMQLSELRESKKQLEDSLQRVTDVIEEATIHRSATSILSASHGKSWVIANPAKSYFITI